jgi:deoxyribose-phosphate aldolase
MVTSSIVEKAPEDVPQTGKVSEDVPQTASEEKNLENVARRALGLVDLTSLSDEDDDAKIAKLCASARTKHGTVAAVCVYSHFVRHAKAILGKKGPDMAGVRIATVANFPKGGNHFFIQT